MIYTDGHCYFSSDFKKLREKYPKINIWLFVDEIVIDDYFGWKTDKKPYDGVFQDNKNNVYVYKEGKIINSFDCRDWEKYISQEQIRNADDLDLYIYD